MSAMKDVYTIALELISIDVSTAEGIARLEALQIEFAAYNAKIQQEALHEAMRSTLFENA